MAVRSRASGEGQQRAAPRRAASTKKSQGSARATRKTVTPRAKRPAATAKVTKPKRVPAPVDGRPLHCTERTDGYKVLVFGPSCGLEEAGALRDALLEALADGTPLVLDGSGIERIDTAGLQLLVGLSFECMERGIPFGWRDRSAALKDAIALTGVAPLLESPTPVTLPASA